MFHGNVYSSCFVAWFVHDCTWLHVRVILDGSGLNAVLQINCMHTMQPQIALIGVHVFAYVQEDGKGIVGDYREKKDDVRLLGGVCDSHQGNKHCRTIRRRHVH